MCMTESVCVIIVIIFQCTQHILFSMNGLLVCLIASSFMPIEDPNITASIGSDPFIPSLHYLHPSLSLSLPLS